MDLPDDLFEEGLNPWKFFLISRLYLQKVKFIDVAIILRNQWKLVGDCKLIPLGKCYFAIKLDNEIDRKYIRVGAWDVLNQRLKIRNWKIIFKICEEIGTPIKVDEATLKCDFGYYANVLVEVDFAQPIPGKIWINTKFGGFFQSISIPDSPKFCNNCRIIGHLVTECRAKKNNNRDYHNDTSPFQQQQEVDKQTPVK
ncbi:uncharacterized protein LOC113351327 [Papaver somniferum]|uniref:uncharacterized protein LOC113351327 n=1 Tax=Papaver somniferum TaxID=3469 RepID=UPI000E6F84CB|nr:uncharacterized protein LOC113351327 [Papaver somniferum]